MRKILPEVQHQNILDLIESLNETCKGYSETEVLNAVVVMLELSILEVDMDYDDYLDVMEEVWENVLTRENDDYAT